MLEQHLSPEGAKQMSYEKFQVLLGRKGYMRDSIALSEPFIEFSKSGIRSLPSDPRQINLGARYKRPGLLENYSETVIVVPRDDNSFSVTGWVEESKYGERYESFHGIFDPDGYPTDKGSEQIAESMGLMEPIPQQVCDRVNLSLKEIGAAVIKIVPSYRGGLSLLGKAYLGWGGWTDGIPSSARWINKEEIKQRTGTTLYNNLYYVVFDQQDENGERLEGLFKQGQFNLPGGGKFCRFHPRSAFFVEGQLIQEGQSNECAWAVLATK